MGNQQLLRLFLVLLVSTVYIFSFSQIGALAYNTLSENRSYFAEGTIIGNVPVGGKTKKEALALVEEEISKWLDRTSITLEYMGNSKTLDLSYIQFDAQASVENARHGIRNLVAATISPLNEFLKSLSPSIKLEDFNVKALESDILNNAQVLEPGEYIYRVENFYVSASLQEDTVIEQSPIKLNQEDEEIKIFDGKKIKVEPKTLFSLLNYLKEEQLHTLSGQTLNKIASAVYTVILPTNFSILERHISNTLPSYAVLGFEAKVDVKRNFDLAFSNPNDSEYVIEFAVKKDSLIVSLKGPEFLNEYKVALDDEKSFEPKTIKQYSPQIKTGKIVKSQGQKGLYVKVYRELYDESGALLQRMLISEDFYAPVHRVEIYPLKNGETGKSAIEENQDETEKGTGEEIETQKEGQKPSGENEGGERKTTDGDSDEDLWGNPDEIPKK